MDQEVEQQVLKTRKLPKYLTTVTPFSKALALIIFVTFPLLGFYLGIKYQKLLTIPPVSSVNTNNTTTISNNILLSDLKKLNSEVLVSDWKTKYAVYIRRKDTPIDFKPFGQDIGSLAISNDLVVLNLESGERKIYDFNQDTIPSQMVDFLKNGTSEGGSHFRLSPQLLRWSPFSENVFWVKLNIYSNGDPPMANEVGLIKMDIKDSKIDQYTLPSHGLFGAVNENTNAEKILYESIGDGLSLYEFDLKTGKDKLIISYPKNIFDKFCTSSFEYAYTSGFYGNCGRDRGLRAEWGNSGFSYFDFVTGKKVNITAD